MVEALKIPAHQPTSVGAMLKEEFLQPLGISQGELAKAMGVGRKTVNELCGGRRGVTAETAFLLAKVLGTTPEFWLNLQLINDMWLAVHNEVLAEKLKQARPLVAA
jgi:addiction module HigA family antidote